MLIANKLWSMLAPSAKRCIAALGSPSPDCLIQLSQHEWLIPACIEYSYEPSVWIDAIDCVCVELLCSVPEDTALAYEIEYGGLDFITEGETVHDWAMQNGICPGQAFWVYARYEYSLPVYPDYECDAEMLCWVVEREYFTPREHAAAWQQVFEDYALERAQEKDHEAAWEARKKDATQWYALVDCSRSYSEHGYTLYLKSGALAPCECCTHDRVLFKRVFKSEGYTPLKAVWATMRRALLCALLHNIPVCVSSRVNRRKFLEAARCAALGEVGWASYNQHMEVDAVSTAEGTWFGSLQFLENQFLGNDAVFRLSSTEEAEL